MKFKIKRSSFWRHITTNKGKSDLSDVSTFFHKFNLTVYLSIAPFEANI